MANFHRLGLMGSPLAGYGTSTTISTFTINSAGGSIDRVGWRFFPPTDDTITQVGFRYGVRTGTPVQHRIGIQTLGTDGLPSGTYFGGGSPASATFTPPADTSWNNTWRKITLDNSIALTPASRCALVIEPVGTPDGSNNSSVSYGITRFGSRAICIPMTQTDGGAWTPDATRIGAFAVYSASACYGFPIMSVYATALGTNGHRLAGRWTPLATHFGASGVPTISGLQLYSQAITGGGSIKACIWEGTTERASGTFDTDAIVVTTTGANLVLPFDTPYAVTPGTEYRLGMERVDVSCGIDGVLADSATEMVAFDGGADFMKLSTWNGSSWTDTDTTRLWVTPIISDLAAAAGGGGGGLIIGSSIIRAGN